MGSGGHSSFLAGQPFYSAEVVGNSIGHSLMFDIVLWMVLGARELHKEKEGEPASVRANKDFFLFSLPASTGEG